MVRISFLLLFLFFFTPGRSFNIDSANATAEKYIADHKAFALREMKVNGIPASITLAQGMVETACGSSVLARFANNHFGIKCHEHWSGETYLYTDDAVNECFRKYNSAQESYSDHSNFLRSRDRYAFLFKLRVTDYRGWAKGLKAAGYATNPRYAQMLIDMIEKYSLNEIDYDFGIPETIPVDLNTSVLTIIDCTPGDLLNDQPNDSATENISADCGGEDAAILFVPAALTEPEHRNTIFAEGTEDRFPDWK
ncbi:MAG TPA: glucosaminidase domain-containing protein [Bacteroidia bacterium]|jgi:hypothetical protein|nr:glucosaminidase domain-containing protein [Bacteroidia bacterium]